eukprot:scaffold3598_cov115-Cylindrotheca_fusiformis.AAC.15
MLVGGINPCTRGQHHQSPTERASESRTLWKQEMATIGSKVLVRFFNCFPLPLSSYIVKEAIQMRLYAHTTQSSTSTRLCTNCKRNVPLDFLLQFQSCKHTFCEPCFWDDILCRIDGRKSNEDVVDCPRCKWENASVSSSLSMMDVQMDELTPGERRQESYRRYELLPVSRQALKSKKETKKKVIVSSSWYAAIVPSLGMTREVRKDKFFSYVERNAIHYVRGCLVAGVDIEWRNEYGQTALYISVWRGYQEVTKLLLEHGANISIVANGGSSIATIAEAKGDVGTMEVWQGSRSAEGLLPWQEQVLPSWLDSTAAKQKMETKMFSTTLIPTSSDHPGAGSFMIDNAFSSDQVDCMLGLCRSLPLDTSQKKKKSTPCSERCYFCDAEGYVRSLIEKSIRLVNLVDTDDAVVVFPYMRFLLYNESGATLAPHVDLCRVDHSTGLRSTHTFIVYLTSNGNSGETALLGDVSGEGRDETLAQVIPSRGRILLFPHACPHEGKEVVDVPKIILRGEVLLSIM